MTKKRQTVWNKSGGLCWYCGVELPEKGWHVDHFESQHKAGHIDKQSNNALENLVPACVGCNLFKSASSLEGFRRHIEKQKDTVRKYSSGFRIAERMGIIEVFDEMPIIFWFEENNL